MNNESVSEEELERGRQWFERYVDTLETNSVRTCHDDTENHEAYRCPCCGFKTLPERGGFDICNVCFWEDDGQDDHDADVIRGGPNGILSLTQARANYRTFGATDRKFLSYVRSPLPEEM